MDQFKWIKEHELYKTYSHKGSKKGKEKILKDY